jgi:hypothetical protein
MKETQYIGFTKVALPFGWLGNMAPFPVVWEGVTWKTSDRIIEFKFIPATHVRNWDGSAAGEGNDPNQIILQKKVTQKGRRNYYQNWW